jgi:NAD(P)-dependent dehydrogenase (short-subunit alcohol dehydrogenase family)
VNNAGGVVGGRRRVEALRWEDAAAVLALNLTGLMICCREAILRMSNRRGGRGGAIVNVSSVSALQAGFAPLTYSVAKAGVLQFTKVAASQLSAHGIRINAVLPGFVATRIFGEGLGLQREQAQALADQAVAAGRAPNPLGHTGQPIDIAQAVLFLASDAAAYVTGTHLVVDGGITIGPRHSWDPTVPPPMAEALGLRPEQLQALYAAKIGAA